MKKALVMGLSLAVILMFSSTAEAQYSSKKTVMTINKPMEIPGKPAVVLGPGTYVIRLLTMSGARNMVQFLSEDETKLYSTVTGIPDYRLTASDKPEITFYEAEPGRALPIRAWFYPGEKYGVEFVNSKERIEQVAKAFGEKSKQQAAQSTN